MRYLPLWQISDARKKAMRPSRGGRLIERFFLSMGRHIFQMIRNDALVDTRTTTDGGNPTFARWDERASCSL
jgi:hypothetical protein